VPEDCENIKCKFVIPSNTEEELKLCDKWSPIFDDIEYSDDYYNNSFVFVSRDEIDILRKIN
jgi:hypothetical protein